MPEIIFTVQNRIIIKIPILFLLLLFFLLCRQTVKASESISYIHTDHLGSTILVTDENGEIVTNQVYYPYGDVRNVGVKLPTEKAYTGQVSDEEETGMYYYNARYYNSVSGIFTQADVKEGPNRYIYTRNNPFKYVDPTGFQIEVTPPDSITDDMPEISSSSGGASTSNYIGEIGIISLDLFMPYEKRLTNVPHVTYNYRITASHPIGQFIQGRVIDLENDKALKEFINNAPKKGEQSEHDWVESLALYSHLNIDYNQKAAITDYLTPGDGPSTAIARLVSEVLGHHVESPIDLGRSVTNGGICFEKNLITYVLLKEMVPSTKPLFIQGDIYKNKVSFVNGERLGGHTWLSVEIDGVRYYLDSSIKGGWHLWPESMMPSPFLYGVGEPFTVFIPNQVAEIAY